MPCDTHSSHPIRLSIHPSHIHTWRPPRTTSEWSHQSHDAHRKFNGREQLGVSTRVTPRDPHTRNGRGVHTYIHPTNNSATMQRLGRDKFRPHDTHGHRGKIRGGLQQTCRPATQVLTPEWRQTPEGAPIREDGPCGPTPFGARGDRGSLAQQDPQDPLGQNVGVPKREAIPLSPFCPMKGLETPDSGRHRDPLRVGTPPSSP